MSKKKSEQLGMNPSTASHRLVKDVLFKLLIEAGHTCFQCGEELTRDTFSIEHMEPWLDSEDPLGLYFNLENIAFSHKSCNYAASRTPYKKYFSETELQEASNRWQKEYKERQGVEKRKEVRKAQYLRTGK